MISPRARKIPGSGKISGRGIRTCADRIGCQCMRPRTARIAEVSECLEIPSSGRSSGVRSASHRRCWPRSVRARLKRRPIFQVHSHSSDSCKPFRLPDFAVLDFDEFCARLWLRRPVFLAPAGPPERRGVVSDGFTVVLPGIEHGAVPRPNVKAGWGSPFELRVDEGSAHTPGHRPRGCGERSGRRAARAVASVFLLSLSLSLYYSSLLYSVRT